MNRDNPPILFMKTGVPGAEPLDFYKDIQDTYRAELHSTDAVRLELGGGKLISNRQMNELVRVETDDRVVESLRHGRNTVYDGFLNTRARRDEVRRRVEDLDVGATVCLLVVEVPWPLVEKSLRLRYAQDHLSIPKRLLPSPEKVIENASRMDRGWQLPDDDENPLYLDGTETVPNLMTHIASRLGKLGVAYDARAGEWELPSYGSLYHR